MLYAKQSIYYTIQFKSLTPSLF